MSRETAQSIANILKESAIVGHGKMSEPTGEGVASITATLEPATVEALRKIVTPVIKASLLISVVDEYLQKHCDDYRVIQAFILIEDMIIRKVTRRKKRAGTNPVHSPHKSSGNAANS